MGIRASARKLGKNLRTGKKARYWNLNWKLIVSSMNINKIDIGALARKTGN
jgi:hypothetical protein